MMRLLVLLLAVGIPVPLPLQGQEPKPPALTPEQQQLAGEARKALAEGQASLRSGNLGEAIPKLRRSVELFRKVYPAAKYPDGKPELIDNLSLLGLVLRE